MRSCVFDIETAPGPDAALPPTLVEKLKASEGNDWRDLLGIYAPSARVIVVVTLDLETSDGIALVDDAHPLDGFDSPAGTSITVERHDEPGILRRFWEIADESDRVITYNGRRFDVPFLMQRSLIQGIPVHTHLLPHRQKPQSNHLDLADTLSLYGATRPFGLAVWSEAIGHASPKEGEVQGSEVGAAYQEGRIRPIAEYCARDVVATAALARQVLANWPALGG